MTQTLTQPDEATEREDFHITDDASANWYLRKIAALEDEKARVKAQCEAIVKRLDGDAEGLRRLYESELQTYVRQKLADSKSRRKSVHFLQGTAQFRTVPARVVITDPQAALDYARQHLPDAVKVSESLHTDTYRAAVEARGELLPGCDQEPERETFTLSFGKARTLTE